MKKVLIVIGLVIVGFAIGGGIAYLEISKGMASTTINSANNSELLSRIENNSDLDIPDIVGNSFDYEFYIIIKDIDVHSKKYDDIDLSDLNSINTIVAKYKEEYKNLKGTKDAEAGYLIFLKYYYNFLAIHSDKVTKEVTNIIDNRCVPKNDSEIEMCNKPMDDYIKKCQSYGFNLSHDEAYFYPVVYNKYLYDNFNPYLPKEWQEYLKFSLIYDQVIISDAHFMIDIEDIKSIIKFCEEFLLKYPDFCNQHFELEKVVDTYKRGLTTYPSAL